MRFVGAAPEQSIKILVAINFATARPSGRWSVLGAVVGKVLRFGKPCEWVTVIQVVLVVFSITNVLTLPYEPPWI
ncbi:hypothetical protein CGZ80_25405 [Rhodopirellula sp. MGV]|nr:hypothetical protein CGZ80_25405 [Rhodopirellula sp. MGV]PNY36976.1 hypothetical protein C2E31_10205 [Rhodopirellula baltica]